MDIVYAPTWFYGFDFFFSIFAIAVLIAISAFAYKISKFGKEKKYRYLSISFLLIAASFFFKILTNLAVYYRKVLGNNIEFFDISLQIFGGPRVVFNLSLVLYYALMLLGLFGIFALITKLKEKRYYILLIYFILVISIFSGLSYYVFHVTAALFLFFITYYYYQNYKDKKTKRTFFIALAFFVILISHLIMALIIVATQFYAVASIVQLIGYGALLYNYILIKK